MKMKKSMKMRIASKKILSLLLAAAMMLCLLPVSVRAAEGSDFIVTCTSGTYNYQDGVLTLHEGTFSVSMAFGVTTTTDKIVVIPLNSGSIHITLNAVRIDLSGISGECALDIIFPCSVEVTAGYGLGILKSGAGQPYQRDRRLISPLTAAVL